MDSLGWIPSSLLVRAHPLSSLGLHELAWLRDDALQLIEVARRERMAILGGDVYSHCQEGYSPMYDNWYCDRREEEAVSDFCARSCVRAKEYVQNYDGRSFTILFVLVMVEASELDA